MNAGSTGQTCLTITSENETYWSPDSARIAFNYPCTGVDEGGEVEAVETYSVTVDSSTLTNLTNSRAYDDQPAWTAAQKK